MNFNGKVVIVTGSSSGIGQEAALVFGKEGASVTIHGQSEERLKKSQDLLKKNGVLESKILLVCGSIEKDETQKRLIDETVKKFGKLDVLVNNAGLSHQKNSDPNSIENYDYVMNTNLRSVIALTRLAVPHLEKTQGNIVNVSSIVAQRGFADSQPYAISKAGLNHYTIDAAIQFADKGVRVNAVSPGFIRTDFFNRNFDNKVTDVIFKSAEDNSVPLRRAGTPKEVANVIEFLASEKASYITGSNIVVDGGVLAGKPAQKR